jgi:hypothetical protein
MMKDMMKMMDAKKSGGEMSEQEIQAKMDVVQELLQMAQEAMGSRVKSDMDEMQKVSVAAPDKESLLAGLEMASEVAEGDEEGEEEKSPMAEMMMEEKSPEAEMEAEEAPVAEVEEEESSPFMKAKAKPAKKKLFSMED